MADTAPPPINNTGAPLEAPGAPTSDPSTTTSFAFPLPQSLLYPSSTPPELITQGAEGRLYKSTYLTPSTPCALKHRPSKPYRHPTLDARLTRHRILSEARILQKCRREGVCVPALYAVDESQGTLAIEWVPGVPVRVSINEFLARRKEAGVKLGEVVIGEGGEERLVALLKKIGLAVGALHKAGVVHGDLTTSNMMLRPWEPGQAPVNGDGGTGSGTEDEGLDGEIVIIDFGLASQGSADEDRAVDLYVLERAFASTHPKAEGLFDVVLGAYGGAFKAAPVVLKKLEDVRMRGRKRSMLG
jgi:TP53 regulating kinase and related kinases